MRIPVVPAEDPLYGRLRELAGYALELVARALPLAELQALTGLERRLLFAMAYHDIGWEVLRLAVESGRVERPAALTSGDATDMRGAAAVIALYPPFLRLSDDR